MRLDTTTDSGAAWALDHGYTLHEDDPGADDVIDLCVQCAHNNDLEEVADAEHPPYDDDIYICAWCGGKLDDAND